jgi:chaperone required for assembly of F1-ATPase
LKRFYTEVTVAADGDGHAVLLDGRPVRTPRRRPVVSRSRPLAEALAAEWAAQGETIRLADMPLVRLVNTALDRIAEHREHVVDMLSAYGGSDLVCYRAERPAELRAAQEAAWDPLLAWADRRHAARLAATRALMPLPQDAAALARLRAAVAALDDFRLVALHEAVTSTGSLLIGLALVEGELEVEPAWQAALVDERHQEARWGLDADTARRREAVRRDLEQAVQLVRLLDG